MDTTQPPNDGERLAAKKALAVATEVLGNRVSALADVVEINNQEIKRLRGEVNKKPDDEEVKFITGLAHADRKVVRNRALATAIISALVSGAVAFGVADRRSDARCQGNKETIDVITSFLETIPEPSDRLLQTIDELHAIEREC